MIVPTYVLVWVIVIAGFLGIILGQHHNRKKHSRSHGSGKQ